MMVTSVFWGITDLEPELGNSGLPKCTPFFYCENLTFPKKHDLLLREKTTHISEQQAQDVFLNFFHLDNTSRVLSIASFVFISCRSALLYSTNGLELPQLTFIQTDKLRQY